MMSTDSRAVFTLSASDFLSNLALIILAHSLPAMDVSPGNQVCGSAWLSG